MLTDILKTIKAKFRFSVQTFKVADNVNVALCYDKKAKITTLSVTGVKGLERRTATLKLIDGHHVTPVYMFLKQRAESMSDSVDSQLIAKISMMATNVNANGRPSTLIAA